MFVTRKYLSRRTILRGMGVAMALPVLDAMTPAFAKATAGQARAGAPKGLPPRLVCIEMVHGAAGSSQFGYEKNLWAPAAEGRDFDLGPTSLKPLEPFRDYLTIVSNCDVPSANSTEAREIGGDHFRSTAVFLTQSYPKRTEGADVEVGTSFDQVYAQRFGRDTTIPSMQVAIESVDEGGGCQYGYSCAYVDSLSWATPHKPLPMVRDPRVVFDLLFGMFKKDGTPAEQRERLAENRSMLDWLLSSSNRLRSRLGTSDRARLDEYLDNVRELERRIQTVEAFNQSGEQRELPGAPVGVPDSYSEHVKLMFDLQLLAFTTDVTRVFSLKLSRDGSNRVFPGSGFGGPFHNTSHHGAKEQRILDFAKINTYHVGLLPYFLQKLKDTRDGDSNLLENSLVMYGSPMGDPNFHNHKRVPFILAGRAGGALKGGTHYKAPNRTPLSNVMLSLLHSLGLDDLKSFGDSEEPFPLS